MSRKRFSSVLFLSVVWASAHAAVVGAQEQGDQANLEAVRGGRIAVDVVSEFEATVEAAFEIASAPLTILIAEHRDQTVTELDVRLDGVPLDAVVQQRSSALRAFTVSAAAFGAGAQGATRSLAIGYRVRATSTRHRYPLPVPDAALPSGAEIRVRVLLPAGQGFAGDSFPRLTLAGLSGDRQGLIGATTSAPSFAHVVFAPDPGRLGRHQRIEIFAIVIGLLVPGVGFVHWWRRTRSTREPA